MKVRTRLTLLFTFVTAMLVVFYSVAIYYSSSEAREKSFYAQLRNEAVAKANLFFQSTLSEKEMHRIYKNNSQTLNEVQVAIYDSGLHLIYHDDSKVDYIKETPEMLSRVFKNKDISFYLNDLQGIGIAYQHNGKEYVVTAAGYDQYGYNSINNLLIIGFVAFTIILLLIYICGIFLSKKALNPAADMVDQIKRITAGKLNLRLDYPEQKDEFYELTDNFNQMLERLENSFSSQKSFVANISHELNTPLAAITAELEMALEKEYPAEQYKIVIRNTLEDVQHMGKLSAGLMNLAKASYDPDEISFTSIRVDEVLLDSCAKILKENPTYKVQFNINSDIEEEQLILNGNSYLLLIAFSNIIDNGCKYSSDNSCIVNINNTSDKMYVDFVNVGNTISQNDLKVIFQPFFRSQSSFDKKGYGIGLHLTEKIVKLHHAQISVRIEQNTTIFTILF